MEHAGTTTRRPEKKGEQVVDLDTAISMAGLGRFHLGLIFVAGGCLATITSEGMATSFALPIVECEMDLSIVDKGVFSGATTLGMILTTNVWGLVSDIYGRRGVITASLASGWLFSVSSSLAPTFWLVVVLRAFSGAAYCGMASTFYAYVTEFLPPKHRSTALAYVFLSDGIVLCLIPVIAWLILPINWGLNLGFVVVRTWRLMFLVNSLYAVGTMLLIMWFPESPKYLVSVDRSEDAIDVLGKVFRANTGNPTHEYPVKGIKKTVEDDRTVRLAGDDELTLVRVLKTIGNQFSPIFGRKYLFVTMIGCFLQFSVYSSAYGFILWLPDMVNRVTSREAANPNATITICDAVETGNPDVTVELTCRRRVDDVVYATFFIFGAAYFGGCALVGTLVKIVGRRRFFVALQLASGMAGFGVYWATGSIPITILLTVYTLLPSVAQVLSGAILLDQYPTHLRSTAMCVALSFARLGATLTANGLGIFFERDCTIAILTLGTISSASGLASLLVPKEIGQRMAEPIRR